MTVLALGLNHTTAPLDLRGRLAFGPEQLAPTLRSLRERLAASPLRDARGFSTDWYAMVERAMADPVRK
jgi:hypothetical protein